MDCAFLRIDERVVCSGIELDFQLARSKCEVLDLGTEPLGSSAQGVSVLVQACRLRVLADNKL